MTVAEGAPPSSSSPSLTSPSSSSHSHRRSRRTVTEKQQQEQLTDESVTTVSAQGLGDNQVAPQSQSQQARPKSVLQWSVLDVQKWLRRHCGDYYHLYSEKFLEQDITGRSLVRLSENSLLRLGIVHPEHRQAVWREIAKLRLRSNFLILKDADRRRQQQETS